jgi:Amt family ammonium transporter
MNTFISGATGGLTVFFIHYFLNSKNSNRYSLVMLCNGNLAGLVSITG